MPSCRECKDSWWKAFPVQAEGREGRGDDLRTFQCKAKQEQAFIYLVAVYENTLFKAKQYYKYKVEHEKEYLCCMIRPVFFGSDHSKEQHGGYKSKQKQIAELHKVEPSLEYRLVFLNFHSVR